MRVSLRLGAPLLLVAALVDPSFAVEQPNELNLPRGGINLTGVTYYHVAFPFLNVAGYDDRWISSGGTPGAWDDGRVIPLTADRYPAQLAPDQDARSLIFTHNGSIYPTGQYVLTWDGTGTIEIENGASLVSTDPVARRSVYEVSNAANLGLLLYIRDTSPADPIRNVQVRLPGTEQSGSLFNPDYVADLEGYGVIRTMDWNRTNNNPYSEWSQRSTPTTYHVGSDLGVPYETQIALANETQQDLWVTVPHRANDNYVAELAQLIDDELDPNLRVWVEYSNETWNTIFDQFFYTKDVLVPQYQVEGQPPMPIHQAYGRRSAEVFGIFDANLANPRERMIRVVAGQAANSYQLDQALIGASFGGEVQADVAAVAPYFSLTDAQMTDLYVDYQNGQVDLAEVFATLRTRIDERALQWQANADVADARHLPLIAYEAGQHLTPIGPTQRADAGFVELLANINRDERMGNLYTYMTEQWHAIGGETITFFADVGSWSEFGFWGLKENYLDDDSPKFQAVQDFLNATETLSGDYNRDGRVDAADYTVWRDSLGTANPLADGDANGTVDTADYSIWRVNFGRTQTLPSQGSISTGTVPEPGAVAIGLGGLGALLISRRVTLPRPRAYQIHDAGQRAATPLSR